LRIQKIALALQLVSAVSKRAKFASSRSRTSAILFPRGHLPVDSLMIWL
jgi:hypothetical protein